MLICSSQMAELCNTIKNGDIVSAQKQHYEIYKVCSIALCAWVSKITTKCTTFLVADARFLFTVFLLLVICICRARPGQERPVGADDAADARAAFQVCKAVFCESNPIPCKAAGAMMGLWKNNLRCY